MKRVSVIITFVFLLLQKATGGTIPDSTLGTVAVSANYHYGFIIAHRQTIVPLQKDHVKGFELSVSMPATGKKNWQRLYNYPSIGLKYFCLDLGNESQLGFGQAIIPYFNFRFNKNENVQFNFQYGWGLGYIQRPFDAETNYKNVAIGSHWNAAISLSADMRLKLSGQTFLNSGLSLTHFSNGSAVVPNLGINIASVKVGVTQYLGICKRINRDSLPAFRPGFRNSIYLAGGVKQIYPVEGPDYYVWIFSGGCLKQFTRKSAAGLALDLHYDQSLPVKREENFLPADGIKYGTRAGISATYELIFSDFSMLIQMGGYFYNSYKPDGNFYNRLGWRYSFFKNYFACINLKSHWAKADFFEFGAGRNF
ncbi:MAG: acyloxyacyl hydrolase [Bacteroidia bacterium]